MAHKANSFTPIATVSLNDAHVSALGINKVIYVPNTSDKFFREITVLRDANGRIGVAVTGCTVSNNAKFADKAFGNVLPSVKRELARIAFGAARADGMSYKDMAAIGVSKKDVKAVVKELLA